MITRNILFFLLLIVLPTFCYAQKTTVDRPDKLIEPNPFTDFYFQDHYQYDLFNEKTVFFKKKDNNFTTDTIEKTFYHKNGNRKREIEYSKGVPASETNYEYYNNGDLKSWESNNGAMSLYTYYTYGEEGKVAKTDQFRINHSTADSNLVNAKKFLYDQNRLVEIQNKPGLTELFSFQGNQLLEVTGSFISKSFSYDSHGKLIEINEYMGGEVGKSDPMKTKKFSYNTKGLLVCDSLIIKKDLDKNDYQITHYEYDQMGILSVMKVTYKGSFRTVWFTHEKGRVKEVLVETNDMNSAYLRFWVNSRIPKSSLEKGEYKEVFEYDRKGNKTSKKSFLDGELYIDAVFELEY